MCGLPVDIKDQSRGSGSPSFVLFGLLSPPTIDSNATAIVLRPPFASFLVSLVPFESQCSSSLVLFRHPTVCLNPPSLQQTGLCIILHILNSSQAAFPKDSYMLISLRNVALSFSALCFPLSTFLSILHVKGHQCPCQSFSLYRMSNPSNPRLTVPRPTRPFRCPLARLPAHLGSTRREAHLQ